MKLLSLLSGLQAGSEKTNVASSIRGTGYNESQTHEIRFSFGKMCDLRFRWSSCTSQHRLISEAGSRAYPENTSNEFSCSLNIRRPALMCSMKVGVSPC